MFEFVIPGKPQPKQRARTVNGHSYTPEKTVLYENWVRLCYGNGPKFDGPVMAEVRLFYEVPKSYGKARKRRCMASAEYPTGKHLGDVDNVAKAILDSLNGIAYVDDSRVVMLLVSKRYAEKARAEVTLTKTGGNDEQN